MSKTTLVAGIAMFLLNLSLSAQLRTSTSKHSISVTSDKTGVAGLHGCDESTAVNAPAYLFKLQKKQTSPQGTCAAGSLGKWSDHSKKETDNGKVTFDGLSDGQYRIICLSGEAIGCLIKGTHDRSIVYAKDASSVLTLGQENATKPIAATKDIENNDLLVYPNPASEQITLELQSSTLDGNLSISLYDILGKQICSLSKNYTQDSRQVWEMNTKDFPSGTYLIKVTDEQNQSLHQKIIIENKQ